MHTMRALAALTIFIGTALHSSTLLGMIQSHGVLSTQGQPKTPIPALSSSQTNETESGMNTKMVLKTAEALHLISLVQNNQNGAQLIFSDGSMYEIAPVDRAQTSVWLSPILITIEPSGDPTYPWKITNTVTNISVSGKLITPPSQKTSCRCLVNPDLS